MRITRLKIPLMLILLLTGTTTGYSKAVKLNENEISVTVKDLNEVRYIVKEAQYLRESLLRERKAYDELADQRASYDAERDAETQTLREQVKAMQRKIRSDKTPHLYAFAEAYRSREYTSDYRVGIRLEMKLF